jgi:hypothetical protein
VSLSDLTRESVLAAVAEHDRLGREAFLAEHGFAEARSWLLVQDGRGYDSKAIVGVAHGYATGGPLAAAEFTGADATVGAALRRVGRVRRPGEVFATGLEVG